MSQQIIPLKKHNLELTARENTNSSLERLSSANPFLLDNLNSNTNTERSTKRLSTEFFEYKPGRVTSEAIMKKLKKNKIQNVKLRYINLDQSNESKNAKRENSFDSRSNKPVSPLRYVPPEEKNRGKDAQTFRDLLKKTRGNSSSSENRVDNGSSNTQNHKIKNNTRIEIIKKDTNIDELIKSHVRQIDLSSNNYHDEQIYNKPNNYNKYLNRKTAIAHIDFS